MISVLRLEPRLTHARQVSATALHAQCEQWGSWPNASVEYGCSKQGKSGKGAPAGTCPACLKNGKKWGTEEWGGNGGESETVRQVVPGPCGPWKNWGVYSEWNAAALQSFSCDNITSCVKGPLWWGGWKSDSRETVRVEPVVSPWQIFRWGMMVSVVSRGLILHISFTIY